MKRTMVAILLSLCALTAVAKPKEEALALAETFEAGARAGKVEQMVSIYADDAVLMPPNMPSMIGREAIAQYWGGLLQAGKVDLDLIMEDFHAEGDLAVERGRYEVTSPMVESGKYVLVLRKQKGKWLVVTDIFNASQAAPTQ
jgi:ketosteroid isomerase-like protein